MRAKNISFAEVIKRKTKHLPLQSSKQKTTLSNLLKDWQINPNGNYTLYLDQSSITNKSKTQYPTSMTSRDREDNAQELFDSWIQKQANISNKENSEREYNRYCGEERKDFLPKKIILTSKGRDCRSNLYNEDKTKFSQIKPSNYLKTPMNIEIITSRQFEDGRMSSNRSKSPMSCKHHDSSIQFEDGSNETKSPRTAVGSFTLQKQPRGVQINDFRNMKKTEHKCDEVKAVVKQKQCKVARRDQLQDIISSTDNIHLQIAQLAHRIVLQDKKKQQAEQQQLLLSIEEQKRVSLNNDKKDRPAVNCKSSQNEVQDQIQKKLRQQVRKQVDNFLKTNQSKKVVPCFGQRIQSAREIALVRHTVPQMPQISEQQTRFVADNNMAGLVGYSFSTCLENTPADIGDNIPLLNIPQNQAPVIPHIPEITSERHPSQSNQQIYDFYQRWKKQNQCFEKGIQNAQNIVSVVYRQHQQCNEQLSKDIEHTSIGQSQSKGQQAKQIHIGETFGKNMKICSENICEQRQLAADLIKQKRSMQKPQIIINIPLNYREQDFVGQDQNYSDVKTKQANVQLQSNLKTQILFLSASPQTLSEIQEPKYCSTPNQLQIELQQPLSLTKKFTDIQQQNGKNEYIPLDQKITPKVNSPTVMPKRQDYLQSIEQSQQNPNYSNLSQLNLVNYQTETGGLNHKISSQKPNTSQNLRQSITQDLKPIQHANAIQRQSPANYFNNYCLNKVYSTPKQPSTITPPQPPMAITSEFTSVVEQQKGESSFAIPYIKIKYDGGQYNFANVSEPVQAKVISIKKQNPGQSKSKLGKLSSGHGSNKAKDKSLHKIQSYAYTSNFNINNCIKNYINEPVPGKSEETEEFNFDF